jgi:hypothetical protein
MEVNDMEWRNDREAGRDRPPLVDVVWIRRELGIPACGSGAPAGLGRGARR